MTGGMTFQEALSERLAIIRPSRQNVTQYITKHPPQFTEGIRLAFQVFTPKHFLKGHLFERPFSFHSHFTVHG